MNAISSSSSQDDDVDYSPSSSINWRLVADGGEGEHHQTPLQQQQEQQLLEDKEREEEAIIAIVTTDDATSLEDNYIHDEDEEEAEGEERLLERQQHHLETISSTPPPSPSHHPRGGGGPSAASPPPSPPHRPQHATAYSIGHHHNHKEHRNNLNLPDDGSNNDNSVNHALVSPDTDEYDDDDADDEYALAMAHAAAASQFLQVQDYGRALAAYQAATVAYQQTEEVNDSSSCPDDEDRKPVSLLAICNAAACWRNIGGIHARHLQDYDLAAAAWQEAEALYWSGLEQVQVQQEEQEEDEELHPKDKTRSTDKDAITFCLDALWMETLQARASLHYRFHEDLVKAMACHEQVVGRLLELDQEYQQQQLLNATDDANGLRQHGGGGHRRTIRIHQHQQPHAVVSFVPLEMEQHTRLLLVSLESLATLYRQRSGSSTPPGASVDETAVVNVPAAVSDDENGDRGLALFHDALYMIRQRYEQQHQKEESAHHSSSRQDDDNNKNTGADGDVKNNDDEDDDDDMTDRLLDSMTNLLRILSDLYFQRGNIDRAVDAMHDVMDIKLSRDEQNQFPPDEAVLQAMDKMGQANEQMEQYDKALQCYEKALLARSRYLGPDHIDVAKSLVHVARVMELQGNTDGSMDLYRAAQAIYARQVTSQSFAVEGEDAHAILLLIPAILEQGRYVEAVAYLNKCLEAADDADRNNDASIGDQHQQGSLQHHPTFDKSQIYYDLGRAYVGLEDYMPATICLVEAAKENGSVTQEEVVALLQHVEFLQQQQRGAAAASSSSSFRATDHYHHDDTPSSIVDDDSSSDDDDSARPYGEAQLMMVHSQGRGLHVLRDEPLETTTTSLVPVPPKDIQPYSKDADGRHHRHHHHPHARGGGSGRMSHPPKGSNTPVTWDGLSGSESKSATRREGEKSETFESSDDEEATAYDDSGPEAGNSRIPRSDVSSSDDGGDSPSRGSFSNSPPITIDPVPVEDEVDPSSAEPERSSTTTSPTSSSRPRRGVVPFADKFRRKRRDGFESLLDEEQTTTDQEESVQPAPHTAGPMGMLPAEDDYHTLATFDGPVEYVDMRSPSWESGISQITLRYEDPKNRSQQQQQQQQPNQQEWWWGVTSTGFGRWFPAAYVSKAVQAAEGFLSAEAIHSKKKQEPSPSVFVLSDEDEDSASDDDGSAEGVDHPSNMATSKATRPIVTTRPLLHKNKSGESPNLDSMFSTPSRRKSPSSPGNFSKEIARCQQRLKEEEKERGKTHPDFATALFTLAVLHSRDQNATAAVEAATEALQIQKDNGSTEDAIRSLHFLADLQLHQKNFKASLTYYAEALKMESSRYGYYSDATAKTLNCIGAARSLQNEFALAMESHQEALTILKESHGEDPRHPLVLDTLCEIGSVYYRERNSFSTIKAKKDGYSTFIEGGMLEVIGRAHEERGSYKMAISFFEEKLQFLENRGQDALEETSVTLNSLGMLCTRAGLFAEALDYYERALSLQLQVGCDEVDVATARVLTAAVHYQLGRWPEALALLEDALNVLQRELGDDQPTVAATLFQLGVVRSALCEHEMAMVALKRALTLQAELLGDDHPATLRTNREIGKMYSIYETELDSAFAIFNDVLDAQKIVHGDRHPNIADTLHCIGAAYARKEDFSNALRILEESYYMRLEFLGWDHPLQATTLHEIANIHLVRGRLKKASHICDVVLRIRSEGLSDKHIDVARTLLTKGCCLTAKGDFSGAAQCLKAALRLVEDLVGDNHPLVADVRVEMGVLFLRKCQFDEARREIQVGLDIYHSKLDKDHPSIQKAEEKLAQVEHHEMLCV